MTERLDVVLAHLQVLGVRRPKYACRQCEDGNVPAPAGPVEGGLPTEALQRIAGLYALEAEIRGQPTTERLRRRQQSSQTIIDALKPWLEARLAKVLRKANRYARSRWAGLVRFLDDGHLEIDNNAVEQVMRPIALGRKNHLFAGSDGCARHRAVLASLIETARLNDINPQAWMTWAIARYVDGHPQSRLDALLPWNYAKTAA